MSESDIAERSRRFYERYHFPGHRPVDQDGLVFLRYFSFALDQCRKERPQGLLHVLDAGCGTGNTSVALARQFRDVRFEGIDQSSHSLALARRAARLDGLKNVRFRRWDLLHPLPRDVQYDVILCLGVLHHTTNPRRVLSNLRRALNDSGVLFLWIYGKHGRYRHSLNARALQYLVSNASTKKALQLAVDFARTAAKGAAMADLIGRIPFSSVQKEVFESPVWIADQFLNPHEELLDLEELMDLTDKTGFVIEDHLGPRSSLDEWLISPALLDRYRRLTEREQLIVQDLLAKPERYFVRLRPVG